MGIKETAAAARSNLNPKTMSPAQRIGMGLSVLIMIVFGVLIVAIIKPSGGENDSGTPAQTVLASERNTARNEFLTGAEEEERQRILEEDRRQSAEAEESGGSYVARWSFDDVETPSEPDDDAQEESEATEPAAEEPQRTLGFEIDSPEDDAEPEPTNSTQSSEAPEDPPSHLGDLSGPSTGGGSQGQGEPVNPEQAWYEYYRRQEDEQLLAFISSQESRKRPNAQGIRGRATAEEDSQDDDTAESTDEEMEQGTTTPYQLLPLDILVGETWRDFDSRNPGRIGVEVTVGRLKGARLSAEVGLAERGYPIVTSDTLLIEMPNGEYSTLNTPMVIVDPAGGNSPPHTLDRQIILRTAALMGTGFATGYVGYITQQGRFSASLPDGTSFSADASEPISGTELIAAGVGWALQPFAEAAQEWWSAPPVVKIDAHTQVGIMFTEPIHSRNLQDLSYGRDKFR